VFRKCTSRSWLRWPNTWNKEGMLSMFELVLVLVLVFAGALGAFSNEDNR
jgi:hypothetical protein